MIPLDRAKAACVLLLAVAQPEGVCVDERGALWIVDDPTGLVRFDGGVAALTLPREGGT